MRPRARPWVGLVALAIGLTAWQTLQARPPIRNAFFNVYTGADTTRLYDLPSNAAHCGVCHFDFDGGGPRNPYGLAVEVARNSGMYATDEEAIAAIESVDHDNDGYSSLIEITDYLNFTNTPTFPGLNATNVSNVLNVNVSEITGHLTPMGSTDTIPPLVTVTAPNGGETHAAHAVVAVTWMASDASGIAHVDIFFSDDNGATFRPVALNEADDGTYDWFVPNRPGGNSTVRVRARDNAGNYGYDDSDGPFTVTAKTGGRVPTTMRDMDLPGTQPLTGVFMDDPDVTCVTCHGNYNSSIEPWYQWKGSMMAQAMRDPLFLACLAVAEQDAPSVGDLCLRCHTPGGWLEGRSADTGGGMITALDRQSVQCDFCHRLVDPVYTPGVSPPADSLVLDGLDELPYTTANGQFVVDPEPVRRGPYADAVASHSFYESPFHVDCDVCGTCHDVSNPVFVAGGTPAEYLPNAFDAPHPDGDLRNMFPIERTFSEWSQSDYANGGVYAPQFAGNKPDGIVSTCQDCHMKDLSGRGCDTGPIRSDLPHHDLTGGNTFIPDILPDFFPSEVDAARLQDGKGRATAMLQMAASLALAAGQAGTHPKLTVTVTNETGHKLPSGYPEGRRIWLNVKAWDGGNNLVYESGAYNDTSGVLTHDADVKIYQIKPGISSKLTGVVGLPVAPSFHFVLNDSVFSDNRIPPRGFTNLAFEAIQSQPVAHSYADGQYWDETVYVLPELARFAEVTLYYQTTTKEYVEFLRDENQKPSPNEGDDLYNAWVAHGRSAPVAMASDTISVYPDPTGTDDTPLAARTELIGNFPNPFNPVTTIRYSLAQRTRVRIDVYDVAGRLVRTLVDEERPAGAQQVLWEGNNRQDERVSSGVYFVKMRAEGKEFVRKAVMLK